jgi:DNA-binding SARP family transcriptional activator
VATPEGDRPLKQPSTLGAVLRSSRLRARLTQQQLATQAGLSLRALRDLERDRVRHPRSGSLGRLVAALRLAEADAARLMAAAGEPAEAVVAGRLRIGVLGPLTVWRGDALVDLRQAKLRDLLGLLGLHPGQVVSRQEIVDALWGEEPPASCLELVHTYVARLRGILEPGRGRRATGVVVVLGAGGYRLEVDADALDLLAFDALEGRARAAWRAGDLDAALALFGQAVGLWRGPVLADLGPQIRRHPAGVAVAQRRLAVAVAHADLAMELRRWEAATEPMAGLCAEEPFHEGLHARLMLALAATGRQAEALGLFGELRARLAEELGVEPGDEVTQAQLRILRRQLPGPSPGFTDGDYGRSGPPAGPPHAAGPAVIAQPPQSQSSSSQSLPHELPSPIAEFTGRLEELHQFTLLLDASSSTGSRPVPISAVDGMGGIGKSTLAIQAANQLADRFPDGQLYVNLHGATPGQTPLAPVNALGLLLRSLGQDPAAIPTEVEEAAVRWRSLAAQRRLLILFDNAYNAAQIRPLLPGSSSCAVLITSRQVLATLEGARQLHLDLLPHEQALELLGRIGGPARVAAEPQAATEVVRLCGRLPLALRIAGARLAARPTWPISELASRLSDASHRLDELTAEGIAVRAAFDVSLQALQRSPDPVDRAAAASFGLLSLPDGPDLDVAAASRLLDQPEFAAQGVLERLVDAHLLETPRPGRYQFHDLVRLHARHHATQHHPEPEQADALNRLFGYYTATAWRTLALVRPGDYRLAAVSPRWTTGGRQFPDMLAALAWLEAERANLLAAISQSTVSTGVWAELAGELAKALYGFFSVRSYWADGARANETVLQHAVRTGDEAAQAQAHNDLGVACAFLGRYQEAIASHQASLAIRRMQGDRKGKAASLNNLGRVYEQVGRYQEAITCLLDSLTIYRDLADRQGQASSLGNLGTVYERMGGYQEASSYLQESLTLFATLGERHGQASILCDIGRVQERLGQYQAALISLQSSLALCRELGHRIGQAECLNNLGRVYARLGRLGEAITCHQDSLALHGELDNPLGKAEALRDLGDALRALDRT